jgi:NAD(P)-dependent dehydrogenase (short-subunit alcohol dehydrogenase family)
MLVALRVSRRDRHLDLNLEQRFFCTRAATPMKNQRRGRAINKSSIEL